MKKLTLLTSVVAIVLGLVVAVAPSQGNDEESAAHPGLADPSKATEKAPDKFRVVFDTTKGKVVIEVTREWAPRGADRFYNLVKVGFFKDIAIFRVISGFMAQFGIHGDPQIAKAWKEATVKDDAVKAKNTRGMVTFATAGPHTRTTQMFINFGDNSRLDGMGFSPFGKVAEGMDVIDSLYSDYGEGAPRGRGPDQAKAQHHGNAYLKDQFPNLDYINSAALEE